MNIMCQLRCICSYVSIGVRNVRLMNWFDVQLLIVFVCLWVGNYVVIMWLLIGQVGVLSVFIVRCSMISLMNELVKLSSSVVVDYSVSVFVYSMCGEILLMSQLFGICISVQVQLNVENMRFV